MDIERAEELKSSLLWAEVVQEMDRKINYERTKLLTCSPDELSLIQAKINIWGQLKKLPEDVIDREE